MKTYMVFDVESMKTQDCGTAVNALRERYLELQQHCLKEERINRAGGRPNLADIWMDRASIYGQISTDLEPLSSPNERGQP